MHWLPADGDLAKIARRFKKDWVALLATRTDPKTRKVAAKVDPFLELEHPGFDGETRARIVVGRATQGEASIEQLKQGCITAQRWATKLKTKLTCGASGDPVHVARNAPWVVVGLEAARAHANEGAASVDLATIDDATRAAQALPAAFWKAMSAALGSPLGPDVGPWLLAEGPASAAMLAQGERVLLDEFGSTDGVVYGLTTEQSGSFEGVRGERIAYGDSNTVRASLALPREGRLLYLIASFAP